MNRWTTRFLAFGLATFVSACLPAVSESSRNVAAPGDGVEFTAPTEDGVPFAGIQETLRLLSTTKLTSLNPLPIVLDFEKQVRQSPLDSPGMIELQKLAAFSIDPDTQIYVTGNRALTNNLLYFGDRTTTGRAGMSVSFQPSSRYITAKWTFSSDLWSTAYFYLTDNRSTRARMEIAAGKVYLLRSDGSTIATSSAPLSRNYHHVRVEMDNLELRYDLYIDDLLIVADEPYIAEPGKNPTPVNNWYFSTGIDRTLHISLDNIHIEATN